MRIIFSQYRGSVALRLMSIVLFCLPFRARVSCVFCLSGVFVSKQKGDTDMGSKVPKDILVKGKRERERDAVLALP